MENIKIYGLSASKDLAEKIVVSLQGLLPEIKLGAYSCTRFSDGEFEISFDETIRGSDVYLVQSTIPNSDNLMELLLAIDAAKRASARKVIAVIPYFGWARQDRKSKPRVSVAAKVVANCLETVGVDRVITVDLHADQEQAFFDIPVDALQASTVLVPYIKALQSKHDISDMVIVSPDMGGAKRAAKFSKALNCPLVICHKTRKQANVVDQIMVIGDVSDKHCVIIDDMVDTAGTVCKAADKLIELGARSVDVCATHGILSGPAKDRIEASKIDRLIITDTNPKLPSIEGIEIVSIASLLANVIYKVHRNESIADEFI